MLNWVRRVFRQAFGFRLANPGLARCTICHVSHRDAGPLVEGLDNFLVCASCVQRLSDAEPLPVEAEHTEIASRPTVGSENPYELLPAVDINSRVCIFCGDRLRSNLLRTLDYQHFVCSGCLAICEDLLRSASEVQ